MKLNKILQKCFLLTNCRLLFDNVNIRHNVIVKKTVIFVIQRDFMATFLRSKR